MVLIGWRWLAAAPRSLAATRLALVGSLAVVGAAPLTGHAVGLAGAPWYAPLLDLVHFGAGAIWLGTLGMVAAVLRRDRGGHLALIEAFSPIALKAGLVTMAAGVVIAWKYLGGLAPLFSTVYGQALLIKLGAIGLTAGIGGYNWRIVLPRLRRGEPAPILQSSRLELVAGKIVGNRSMEVKGKVQNTVGKVQAAYGDLKNDLKKGK